MRRESRRGSVWYKKTLAKATFAYRESLAKALAKKKWSIQDSSNSFEHCSSDNMLCDTLYVTYYINMLRMTFIDFTHTHISIYIYLMHYGYSIDYIPRKLHYRWPSMYDIFSKNTMYDRIYGWFYLSSVVQWQTILSIACLVDTTYRFFLDRFCIEFMIRDIFQEIRSITFLVRLVFVREDISLWHMYTMVKKTAPARWGAFWLVGWLVFWSLETFSWMPPTLRVRVCRVDIWEPLEVRP